jgi:hypothetical protein
LLFSISCKKSQVENQNSVLDGEVTLFDEGSQKIDNSGIKISIENSDPEISTLTDSKGNFSLEAKNVRESFAIVFEKPGIGAYKRFFKKSEDRVLYEMYNDGVYREVNQKQYYEIGSKSTVVVNSMTADVINGTLKLNINVSSPNTTGDKYIRILLQKDLPSISINTITKVIKNVSIKYAVKNGNNEFNICLACSAECQGYLPGDKIYMTAYGDALYSNDYTNIHTGEWMFPNLKFVANNPVTSFQIP